MDLWREGSILRVDRRVLLPLLSKEGSRGYVCDGVVLVRRNLSFHRPRVSVSGWSRAGLAGAVL